MPGPGNILIKVGADAGQAVHELSTVDKALGDTMSSSEKMGAGLKKAALPAAAALGAIGIAAIDATKAAVEDAAAQEHLAGVLERTAGASAAQVAATEDWIAAISKATGVADDELRPALEKIVTATGDVTKGQQFHSRRSTSPRRPAKTLTPSPRRSRRATPARPRRCRSLCLACRRRRRARRISA